MTSNMPRRRLGRTGIEASVLAFGAGPVSTLMVGDDADRQRAVVEHAVRCGINWFDTAATYGDGQSERSLGRALADLEPAARPHVATKVRLAADDLRDVRGAVRRSVEGSLARLGLPHVTLLQLHNSITARRGDEPTSLAPNDVLRSGGVAEAFQELRDAGLVAHTGLTGIGQPAALIEVVQSEAFETIQTPYHLLNPSAGCDLPESYPETNYGNVIAACAARDMGVLAIRVFAGGALLGSAPSPHTHKTPFFPLPLYQRDRARAGRLQAALGPERPLAIEGVRFALGHPQIHSAIIGFADPAQIDAALAALTWDFPPLRWDEVQGAAFEE